MNTCQLSPLGPKWSSDGIYPQPPIMAHSIWRLRFVNVASLEGTQSSFNVSLGLGSPYLWCCRTKKTSHSKREKKSKIKFLIVSPKIWPLFDKGRCPCFYKLCSNTRTGLISWCRWKIKTDSIWLACLQGSLEKGPGGLLSCWHFQY